MKKHIALVSKGALRPPLPAHWGTGRPCIDPKYELCLLLNLLGKDSPCERTIIC